MQTTSPNTSERSYEKARLVVVRVWAAIGCVVLFLMSMQLMNKLGDAVELLAIGIIVGFICSPLTNWLEDRGLKRGLAALIGLVVFLATVIGILFLLAPPFFDQAASLMRQAPQYIAKLQTSVVDLWARYGDSSHWSAQYNFDQVVNALSEVLNSYTKVAAKRLSDGVVSNIFDAFNNTVIFFLALVLGYWLAKDYPTIMRELAVIAGPTHTDDMLLLFAVMSRSMGGYMRGLIIMSALDGLFSYIGFAIIGHPYAGFMGILIAFMHPIPVIGPWISAGFAFIIALFQSPLMAFWTLVVVAISQNVTDNLIGPVVMQSAVNVHPVLSLVAIAIGASIGGVVGMTLAIPLSAAIKGVFVYYFETRTGRQLVGQEGALFKSTAFHDDDGNIVPSFDALDDARFFQTSRLVSQQDVADGVTADEEKEVRKKLAYMRARASEILLKFKNRER